MSTMWKCEGVRVLGFPTAKNGTEKESVEVSETEKCGVRSGKCEMKPMVAGTS